MTLFISDKNVETCKSRTQILATLHKKWLWQNGQHAGFTCKRSGVRILGRAISFVAKHFKIRQKCGDLEVSYATSSLIHLDKTLVDSGLNTTWIKIKQGPSHLHLVIKSLFTIQYSLGEDSKALLHLKCFFINIMEKSCTSKLSYLVK